MAAIPRVVHALADIRGLRVLKIAARYEDADGLDASLRDPDIKMALGNTPGVARRLRRGVVDDPPGTVVASTEAS